MSLPAHTTALRSLTCAIAASALLMACAQPPAGYYNNAEGLSGQSLRVALHNIIDNHTVLTYNQLWSAFQSTDATSTNKVWDIYSDIPGGAPPYVYSFGGDQCGEYNGEGDCYNREHSFPQSWFNSSSPMNSDLFHIYPTDGWVNNKRGNLAYGDVGSADYTSQNGSKTGLCVDPGYNSTVFEPIDSYKGDLARSYFYMLTRYYGETSGWSSPMMTAGDLSPWAVTTLLAWNDLDPVSPKEVARNNAIFAQQNNRNPYIDRPEWVHAVWDAGAGVAELGEATAKLWKDGNTLHIAFSGPERSTATLNIMDNTGRSVYRSCITGPETLIPFDRSPGLYIARFTRSGRTENIRFAF